MPSLYTQRMEKSSQRWWDPLAALFLLLAMLFATWRLQSTDWAEGLNHVRNVALFGVFIGLALGQSRFQRRGILLLSLGYMMVIFIWQWLGIFEFTAEETFLGDKLLILSGRLLLQLGELVANRPINDPLFFIVLLSFPYWFAGLFSGFQLTRYAKGLEAVLPSGILMFATFIYHTSTRDYTWLFGAYIFIALLLLGRLKFLADRKKWKTERVQVSMETGQNFNNTLMASAAVLILLVWVVPRSLPPYTEARDAWRRVSKKWFQKNEEIDNIFASVKKTSPTVSEFYRGELDLGTRISQSATVDFLVYPPAAARNFPRLYWRGWTYDIFDNSRWLTSQVETKTYRPQDLSFNIPDREHREYMSFKYDVFVNGQTTLYLPAEPLSVNHQSIVVYTKIPVEGSETSQLDILTVRASPSLQSGDSYRTDAALSNPTIPELQGAGQDYPDWVTKKYLQLPPDFSPRIKALAAQITNLNDTPYDKAQAITQYLRTEITYAPAISFPENVTDPLEYFLLVGKQGFCNYSASAEVVMLRSVGVPARLAVGFAQGELNPEKTFYTVRERDAHAWPEVYFPGYGWIQFEPTGNQAPLDRPTEKQPAPDTTNQAANLGIQSPLAQEDSLLPTDPNQTDQNIASTNNRRQAGIAVGVLVIIVLVIIIKRRYRGNTQPALILRAFVERNGGEAPRWLVQWTDWTVLTPIEKYFNNINRALKWMGKPQPVHATPSERAETLKRLVPSASTSIDSLLDEHQSALFSSHGGNLPIARRAAWMVISQSLIKRLKILILRYN